MNEKELDQLIDRYIKGSCSPDEKLLLEDWFEKQVDGSLWKWESIAVKLAAEKELKLKIDRSLQQPVKKIFTLPIRSLAASILLVTLSCLALYVIPGTNLYFSRLTYQKLVVPKGKILNIKLVDGSTVFLNSSTIIKYPERFKSNRRELILISGEAWFNIAPDKNRPFIVISGDVETRVLGTAFNIRDYPFLEDVVVTVERGKVEVKDINNLTDQAVYLLPHEQVSVNKQVHSLRKATVNTESFVKWKTGGINFENDLLSTVAKLLEEKYKISIRISDKTYAEKRLTASFESTDSMDDILTAVSSALGMQYKPEGRTILLEPKS